MEKFTVDEIRAYFLSMGGLDVAMGNLSAENIRRVSPLRTRDDIMREFVMEYPSYEEIEFDDVEYNRICKAYKVLQPFHTSSSLHIYEERYLIGGEIYSITSGIVGGDDVTIQRLTNKDDCKHKDEHIFFNNQNICSRCATKI